MPNEIEYLEKYQQMKVHVNAIIDMPDHGINNLINFLQQNKEKLPKMARQKEFKDLSIQEIHAIEEGFAKTFNSKS